MRGSLEGQTHAFGADKLDSSIEIFMARTRFKVCVVKKNQPDGAEETIKSPYNERRPDIGLIAGEWSIK